MTTAQLATPPQPGYRPAYTPEQFAAEVLGGTRTAAWVRQQIRLKKIRSMTRRPYAIPQAEAERIRTGKAL